MESNTENIHPLPYTEYIRFQYYFDGFSFSIISFIIFLSYLFCQLFKVTKSRKHILKFILILSHRKTILCIYGSYTQDCAILRKLRPMTVLFD
jgi:hypothetical protein